MSLRRDLKERQKFLEDCQKHKEIDRVYQQKRRDEVKQDSQLYEEKREKDKLRKQETRAKKKMLDQKSPTKLERKNIQTEDIMNKNDILATKIAELELENKHKRKKNRYLKDIQSKHDEQVKEFQRQITCKNNEIM